LIGDPALRLRLARQARRLALERFDWERLGELQRSILAELAGSPLVIRPAGEPDIPELDRIQRSSPEAVLWEPQGYLAYDCLVAELDGRVVGFVVCRILDDKEGEVLSLVVDPPFRRRGIGKRLMLQVLGRSRESWFLEVRQSNSPALILYRNLGFQEISRRPNYYQDTGETAVVMRRFSC
jgi:ribosomal-protein-alanine acetyltransferase